MATRNKRNVPIRSKKFKRRKRNVNYNIQKPPQDIRITCPAGEHECTPPPPLNCSDDPNQSNQGWEGAGWWGNRSSVAGQWCTTDLHPCDDSYKCCCPNDPYLPTSGRAGGR